MLLIKADNSLLIFSELGSYKPLNWMAAPCTIKEIVPADADADVDTAVPEKMLRVCSDKSSDILEVTLQHIYSDESYDLGEDPGLVKDGVEDPLQRSLAEQIERIGQGAKLVRREYPTAIGPVDIMAVDAEGRQVAIEIKRHGGIDGVEQLTRYCELLNRDPLLAPVRGIFAAQATSWRSRSSTSTATNPMTWARIPVWSRTVWRIICSAIWPNRSSASVRAPNWCAANTRPPSARWISWLWTRKDGMWPSRSSGMAASTASSS